MIFITALMLSSTSERVHLCCLQRRSELRGMRSICCHAAGDGLPMASEDLINITGTDGIKVFPKKALVASCLCCCL
jgi:hypothetical protein